MGLVRRTKGNPLWRGAKRRVIGWLDKEEIEHARITIGPPKSGVIWRGGSVEFEEDILKELRKFVIKLVVVASNYTEGMRATI